MNLTQLKCPRCDKVMVAQDRLGFAISVCDEHGTWLPKGVLVEMLWKFSRTDGVMLDQTRDELERTRRLLDGM